MNDRHETKSNSNEKDVRSIRLQDLSAGAPGLTRIAGSYLAEAAMVCFTECDHKPGVVLAVTGDFSDSLAVLWNVATQQMISAHADLQEATEYGAYGVAILVIKSLTDLTVLSRSRKSTGFDYWLGNDSSPLFQNKTRLEVSGVLRGDDSVVEARVKQKLKQITQSDDLELPGLVVIVEFGTPESRVRKR